MTTPEIIPGVCSACGEHAFILILSHENGPTYCRACLNIAFGMTPLAPNPFAFESMCEIAYGPQFNPNQKTP